MDPVDTLIGAWIDWEAAPSFEPVVRRRLAAIAALGLDSNAVHERVAAWRRAGYDVPSAVQATVNELAGREAA